MLRAVAVCILLLLNTVLWGTLVFLGGMLKFVAFGEGRRRSILLAAWFGERWVGGDKLIFETMLDTKWRFTGLEDLRRDGHYLVISNHLSWIDIFAAFFAFRRGPFIRFFIKQVLIWFPIAGQACWALEFPFMRRYTPEYLARHPEKRGADLETTRLACQRYRTIPVTILNYAEGTRYTKEKHARQQSPYRYLLKPRVGGIGFVLASMAGQLDAVYDMTVIYPGGDVNFWEFVCNRVPWVEVRIRRLDVPREFCSDAITEPGEMRDRFKAWMEELWRQKDQTIAEAI